MNVTCTRCGSVICSSDDLCWFLQEATSGKKPPTEQIIIKPECIPSVEAKQPFEYMKSRSIFVVLCINCKSKIGTKTNFDNTPMYYLPTTKISGNFGYLEHRDKTNLMNNVIQLPPPRPIVKTIRNCVVSTEDIKLFRYKTIRMYQMDLFYQIMNQEQNSLVVLPTGCGKTLIAFMTIMKMMEMNPDTLAIFVCKTVALVEQQCDKFKSLTNISCKAIYGAINDIEVKKKVIDGTWKVIFTTAGLLEEYLKNQILYSQF